MEGAPLPAHKGGSGQHFDNEKQRKEHERSGLRKVFLKERTPLQRGQKRGRGRQENADGGLMRQQKGLFEELTYFQRRRKEKTSRGGDPATHTCSIGVQT